MYVAQERKKKRAPCLDLFVICTCPKARETERERERENITNPIESVLLKFYLLASSNIHL